MLNKSSPDNIRYSPKTHDFFQRQLVWHPIRLSSHATLRMSKALTRSYFLSVSTDGWDRQGWSEDSKLVHFQGKSVARMVQLCPQESAFPPPFCQSACVWRPNLQQYQKLTRLLMREMMVSRALRRTLVQAMGHNQILEPLHTWPMFPISAGVGRH